MTRSSINTHTHPHTLLLRSCVVQETLMTLNFFDDWLTLTVRATLISSLLSISVGFIVKKNRTQCIVSMNQPRHYSTILKTTLGAAFSVWVFFFARHLGTAKIKSSVNANRFFRSSRRWMIHWGERCMQWKWAETRRLTACRAANLSFVIIAVVLLLLVNV